MATSPPYHSYSPSAGSPPYPSHSQLPTLNTLNVNKKRTAAGDAASPALKRRKGSVLSVASSTLSAHPLRQTSFPPDESPFGARSPSVDMDSVSMISGSAVSAAPVKKKRGRKSKAEKAREQTPSVVGGRAMTAVSGVSGGGEKGAAADAAADDDDDVNVTMGVANAVRTAEEKVEEKERLRVLTSQMDQDQLERYEMFRASRVSDAVIKRVVNAAVSQSVPANVTAAVKSVAKVFIGDLIESARRIQCEWITNTDEKQSEVPFPDWPYDEDEHYIDPEPGKDKMHPFVKRKEPPRGPLRPDHVREAWRRYKQSVEGGAVGTLGLWHVQQHSGVDRFGARTGGKRLFK